MLYRVKELANLCQVPPDTIRHYTRIGLLIPQRDPVNGYRQYTVNDAKRLDFIRKAKSLGFSLKEIEHILAESRKGKSPCPMVRDLISHRIRVNRARLEHLMELQVRMEQTLEGWKKMPDGIPDGDSICYLIESVGIGRESTSAVAKKKSS
ncbi:MerR family transcriptional regulator [Methylomarinum vadi]|uniref:MerR family transcriptional regulator n=1 Tax=Methylomarinum vadi TaxID=438855 RepID=UPI0004DFB9AD|nr:MerR family transcriptional regulator [Methylomarinum vadi]